MAVDSLIMKTDLLSKQRLVSRHRDVTRKEVKDRELVFCSVERFLNLPFHFAFFKVWQHRVIFRNKNSYKKFIQKIHTKNSYKNKCDHDIAVFNWVHQLRLHDWLEKLALLFHLIRSKSKTTRDSLARVFPRFALVTCDYFEFLLVHCINNNQYLNRVTPSVAGLVSVSFVIG